MGGHFIFIFVWGVPDLIFFGTNLLVGLFIIRIHPEFYYPKSFGIAQKVYGGWWCKPTLVFIFCPLVKLNTNKKYSNQCNKSFISRLCILMKYTVCFKTLKLKNVPVMIFVQITLINWNTIWTYWDTVLYIEYMGILQVLLEINDIKYSQSDLVWNMNLILDNFI